MKSDSTNRTRLGVIIVDHGSRRTESNDLLLRIVEQFATAGDFEIVEPAHMELAEPSISTAFDRCVQRGAKTVVVFPYFLLPGRHWDQDIPALTAEAAERHPGVQHLVTAPIGVHALMADIISDRITNCLAHALGEADGCDLCAGSNHCSLQGAG